MTSLSVRAYNVLFGDAVLVSVPDRDPKSGREQVRHILIDVGNVLGGEGGRDFVFEPIVRDIRRRLGGKPVDLYVMTHEHLDHVHGLPVAAAQDLRLDVEYAWLTASAEPGYYRRHRAARRKRLLMEKAYSSIQRSLAAHPRSMTPWMASLMANNHPASTRQCVAFVRKLARRRPRYVHRDFRVRRGVDHPFREAKLEVLAPEEDASAYYGWMRPMGIADEVEDGGDHEGEDRVATLQAPEGIDPAAFRRLMGSWGSGAPRNVLAIDQAANNTSVVFMLEWRGWRLLFPGDAELKSWRTMQREGLLRPVHFLKVAHHGSHNGTPPDGILESVFPSQNSDGRRRVALVSTCEDTYGGVPHPPTLGRLEARCDRIVRTDAVPPGKSVAISFPSRGRRGGDG